MAEADASNMLQYKCMIIQVAEELHVDAAYIAGFILFKQLIWYVINIF